MAQWFINASAFSRRVCGGGLILAAIALGLASVGRGDSPAGAPGPAVTPEAPDVIAIRFHADWCSACKKLDPVYSELRSRAGDARVLYLTFDMTSERTRQQAAYLAGALGLDQVWAQAAKQVGVIALIDADEKRILSTLSASEDLAGMQATVRRAVDASRQRS